MSWLNPLKSDIKKITFPVGSAPTPDNAIVTYYSGRLWAKRLCGLMLLAMPLLIYPTFFLDKFESNSICQAACLAGRISLGLIGFSGMIYLVCLARADNKRRVLIIPNLSLLVKNGNDDLAIKNKLKAEDIDFIKILGDSPTS